jgi:hypothetical protein
MVQYAMLAAVSLAIGTAQPVAADDDRIRINDYVEKTGFDFPDPAGAADVLPDGRIIVLAGTEVFRETASGSRVFASLGSLPDADFNEFGASFLKVSPEGNKIGVGNNGGATFDHFQVGVFAIASLTGTWFDANHFQGEWINQRFLALTAGEFGSPAIVTALDTNSANPANPSNRTIIENIGGGSGGIAFDSRRNLYTANGFATSGPSSTGTVKAFLRADWRAAFLGGPALDFEADGTEIVTVLSGAPLGFDRSNNLFVGGSDFFGGGDTNFAAFIARRAVRSALQGNGPVDTNNPAEVRKVDPDPAANSSYDIIINQQRDEVYLRSTGNHVFVFKAY